MSDITKQYTMQLSQLLARWLVVPESADVLISGLSLNSKTVQRGDLFFAYPGTQADGRRYIEHAIEQGAVAVLAEANLGISETTEVVAADGRKVPIFTIANLANECSAIAGEFYANPSRNMQVVGITGTNGKTSCAYFLVAAFTALGTKSGFLGTIGAGVYGEKLADTGLTTADAITVQRTLAALHLEGVRFVAMEVSSHALSQGRVNGVHFDRAVFTNLSQDHLDYHGSMRAYWLAKKTLFEEFELENSIINAKDQHGRELLLSLWGTQHVCGYCQEPIPAEIAQLPLVSAHNVKFTHQGVTARIQTPWGSGYLNSPQIGRYNLSNLLAVIATMGTMGVHVDDILQCITQLPIVPGRMQVVRKAGQPLVIVDYAHTPDALENVLSVLREQTEGTLWCVFGCGGNRDPGKREMMGEIAERLADHVVVTDDNPRLEKPGDIIEQILQGMEHPKQAIVEHDRTAAIAYAINNAQANDIVLLAGKGHETYQQIGEKKRHFSDVEAVEKIFSEV